MLGGFDESNAEPGYGETGGDDAESGRKSERKIRDKEGRDAQVSGYGTAATSGQRPATPASAATRC